MRLLLLLVVVATSTACPFDLAGARCSDEHPCPDGYLCHATICYTQAELFACVDTAGCAAGLECQDGYCFAPDGTTGCTSAADCDAGEVCDGAGACVSDCRSDAAVCGTAPCDAETGLCLPSRCGDRTVDGNEQCDDGADNSDSTPNACRSDCRLPHCGDRVTDTDFAESCDDGAATDPTGEDGCTDQCRSTLCGNGDLDGIEQCDDGDFNSDTEPDACRTNCTPARCRDGVIDAAEPCDDGNATNGDGCDANCTETLCGNGVQTLGEACDDGNIVDDDGCDSNCTVPACGNGIAAGAEQCDDGNGVDGDGCDGTCKTTGCGSGVQTLGESCDDGNLASGDGCDANCTVTACRNGVSTAPEQCDDGNGVNGDGCDSNCTTTGCGNGIRTGSEACDSGAANSDTTPDACRTDCSLPVCGDGVADPSFGESCDDANANDTDGCTSACVSADCGNGVLNAGEQCDSGPGNSDTAPNACRRNCSNPRCGDAVADTGESCDDGDLQEGDGCDSNCTVSACGNAIVGGAEVCDDGNSQSGDGCDSNCRPTGCGNGAVSAGEQCDDGGLVSGDGCDSNCTTTRCGNGIVTGAEQCDDGNTTSGDGCESNCTLSAVGSCAPLMALRFGDASGQQGEAIAASGTILLLAGTLQGTMDFGGGPLTAVASSEDAYFATLAGDGSHLASRAFGDSSKQKIRGVVADGSGNIIVGGHFQGTVDFGGGGLTSAGGNGDGDALLAKYTSAGAHVWSQRFGDNQDQKIAAVAVDAAGSVIVIGDFKGTIDLGGGALTATSSTRDVFVAKFSSSGTHLWSRGFGYGSDQSAKSIGVDGSGNVIAFGDFQGSIDFGGGDLTSAGAEDLFVAKLSGSDGGHLWSRRFGDGGKQKAEDVAVDVNGAALLTGNFLGTLDFGGGGLTSAGGGGDGDIYVAKLSGTDGAQVWSRRFGDGDDQKGKSIAVDTNSNVLVTGNFKGTVDFGGGAMSGAGTSKGDIFVAKLDGNGNHRCSVGFGGSLDDKGTGIAADSSGAILVVGDFQGQVDFGDLLTSQGGTDVVVLKLAP